MPGAKKRSARSTVAKPSSSPSKRLPEKSYAPLVAQQHAKFIRRTPKSDRPTRKRLISAPKLFAKSCRVLIDNRRLFAIILLIYAGLYILLAGGLTNNNLQAVKANLMSGHVSNANLATTLFSSLLTSGSSGDSTSGAYQSFLLIIVSLALIWALRQTASGNSIRARDAFYKGAYPLVPFLLVLLVIGLELIPVVVGAGLYAVVAANGIAVGNAQTGLITLIFIVLAAVSLYLASSSIIALYIAAQPDTSPMQALRSARVIVRFRRFEVIRKLIFLPFVLFVLGVLILMPVARYFTPLATFIFFGLTVVTIAIIHSYLFNLYRELADEQAE